MENLTIKQNNNGDASHQPCKAKWFGLINDTIIPLPGQVVPAAVLRVQGQVPEGEVLYRDHDSPADEEIHGNAEVDLALGNVFYSEGCGCAASQGPCAAPAKLAFAVDDRSEITIRRDQTGQSLRDWFGVSAGRVLLRDLESPHDEAVREDESVLFGDGPVFITRPLAEYCINIEGKVYPWDAPTITVAQIRALGGLPADQSVVVEDGDGHERTLGSDEAVHLSECCRVGRAPKYKRG
jgi:hypothetical protein